MPQPKRLLWSVEEGHTGRKFPSHRASRAIVLPTAPRNHSKASAGLPDIPGVVPPGAGCFLPVAAAPPPAWPPTPSPRWQLEGNFLLLRPVPVFFSCWVRASDDSALQQFVADLPLVFRRDSDKQQAPCLPTLSRHFRNLFLFFAVPAVSERCICLSVVHRPALFEI